MNLESAHASRKSHQLHKPWFNRIEAARAARRFPMILELLADGRIHLSAVRLLAPHLTEDNHESVLREASHRSKREVEQIVARLLPRPDAPSIVRKLTQTAAPGITAPAAAIKSAPVQLSAEPPMGPPPAARPKIEPLAPGRFTVQLTVGEETYRKLRGDLSGNRARRWHDPFPRE